MIDSKEMIKTTGFYPNKALGQNFLVDETALSNIAAHSQCEGMPVLEVGPGFGALTNELAKTASKVLAIEIDKRLYEILSETFKERANIELICEDFLKFPISSISSAFSNRPFIVAANLPYYITSPICLKLICSDLPITRMVLMMQQEAADRFFAHPGDKNYGPLSIVSQYLYTISEPIKLSPASYYPAPEVKSSVLLFERNENRLIENFMYVIKASFSMRRKTLYNNLIGIMSKDSAQAIIKNAGLEPSVRAESLSIEKFIELTIQYNNYKKLNIYDN